MTQFEYGRSLMKASTPVLMQVIGFICIGLSYLPFGLQLFTLPTGVILLLVGALWRPTIGSILLAVFFAYRSYAVYRQHLQDIEGPIDQVLIPIEYRIFQGALIIAGILILLLLFRSIRTSSLTTRTRNHT